jgi:hypothetical protein
VARLELWNDKQQHTVLERTGAADWQVKEPGDWKADQTAVKTLLDGLEKLSFGDVVTESKDKHADMNVADGKATRVLAQSGDKQTLADLYLGKNVGGYTMVRLNGKDEVWQGSGLFPYAVNKEPSGWRDHTIFDFVAADADKLTVEGAGGKLVVSRVASDKDHKPGETGRWKIDEATGGAPKSAGELDEAQVNGAIQAMSTLHASEFADGKKKDDVVKAASLTVTVDVKGKAHTLWLGPVAADDVTVAGSDSPTVFTVKKFSLDRIDRKPIDYRDKTLIKAAEPELASVEIRDGGETATLTQGKDGKWTLAKGTADDTKVKPVVAGFANLQADRFSDEKDASKTGLAKPTGDVIVKLKDKKTVELKIGAATKDGDYYVQKGGDVYLVKKYAVDRFLKKPAELSKK